MEISRSIVRRASIINSNGYGPGVDFSEVSGLNTVTYQLIRSFVLVQLLISKRIVVAEPVSGSTTHRDTENNPPVKAEDSEELVQSAVKCILSIASNKALLDAVVLHGKFPEFRAAIDFVSSIYGLSLDGLVASNMGRNLISELDSVINKRPLIKSGSNSLSVSYGGVLVSIGFNKYKTIDGFVYDVSTSSGGIRSGCNKSKIVMSAFIEEIEKIKKEENALFVFSDSSSSRTFSKLEDYVNFVDLGVPLSKNPRTNNHIKIRFL